MEQHREPYTLGIWKVKPGNENSFIAEWRALAVWTEQYVDSGGTGYLLRDDANPRLFISFGSRKNTQVIAEWRSTPEFQAFFTKAKTMCEEVQPHSMNLVATSQP